MSSDESNDNLILSQDASKSSGERMVEAVTKLGTQLRVKFKEQEKQRIEDLDRHREEKKELKDSIAEIHRRIDMIPQEIDQRIDRVREDIYRNIKTIEDNCRTRTCFPVKNKQSATLAGAIVKNPHVLWMMALGFLLLSGGIYYKLTGQVPNMHNPQIEGK